MREMIKANAALLAVGIATFVLMGAVTSLYGPALPVYVRGFGISTGTAGWLISAHWIGCALGVAAMFVWAATVTPRVVAALMLIGTVLLTAQFNWITVNLGALIYGAGYGAATVVFNPRMLRAFGARGTAMLSLLNATYAVGAIAAPLVFVALANNPVPAFGLCTVIAVAVLIASGFVAREDAAITSAPTEPFRLHLPILTFAMIAIAVEACMGGLGPTALIRAGISEEHAAQLLSAFFLTFLAARVTLGFVGHLLPAFTLFTIALACACASALVAALWAPRLGFVAMGFFAALFFPGEYVTATRKMGNSPHVAPTIIGAGLIGGIFAPILLAPLIDQLGERGFFWIIAGVTATLSVAALASLRSMNR
jgi:FHS family glucose/mannose:H+ symporter-like MFS transporter